MRDSLGVRVVDKHDKYLGLPTDMGRFRKEVFGWLRERVWAKPRALVKSFCLRGVRKFLLKLSCNRFPLML